MSNSILAFMSAASVAAAGVGAPTVATQTRSAQAMPAAYVAGPVARQAGTNCFVPVGNGAKLAAGRKNAVAAKCGNGLAQQDDANKTYTRHVAAGTSAADQALLIQQITAGLVSLGLIGYTVSLVVDSQG